MGLLIPDPVKSAIISECGKYRYELRRVWNSNRPLATWIMLNPSVADANIDDPTIRKCCGFARIWDCGGIIVVNEFAYRATDPRELRNTNHPITEPGLQIGFNGEWMPANDVRIIKAAIEGSPVIAAWGCHGKYLDRDLRVRGLLDKLPLNCLGLTKDGHPKHPLMVPYSTQLQDFNGPSGQKGPTMKPKTPKTPKGGTKSK